MKLVLIESSGKKATIEKYLGKEYKVIATKGHVRDLPARKFAVDIKNNFEPEYTIMPDKKKLVSQLKEEAKKVENVLFATDPDREGEAIAWHLANILKVDPKHATRIEFNEISKNAVQKALKNPREININLVNAQQARRVLDRIVGYKLSPLVSDKIQNKLSAGRVQSVTLRLVVERDREIENFVPEEFWNLTAVLDAEKTKGKELVKASYFLEKNKKLKNEAEVKSIIEDLKDAEFVISKVKRAESKSHPSAPFTTSTLQQEAKNKLGLSLKMTSSIAQALYEGINIPGEGHVALITYIRTDSVRVSEEAQKNALNYIEEKYGKNYIPEKPNVYKSKKNIQDAHEAIRPITLERSPESLKSILDKNHYRLYKLIYDRFLASQMAEARYNTISIEISAKNHLFKTTGKTLIFDGYSVLYNNIIDDNDEQIAKIPNVSEGDKLNLIELKPEQKFTKPPARFTEASLVKMMEDKGIGRPATYSPTVSTLLSRNYISEEGKNIQSTELGRKVVDLLVHYFAEIMDVGFTANMEDKLDDIEEGGEVWQNVIGEFYKDFHKSLLASQRDRTYKIEQTVEESDEICDKCGANMIIKTGKFGKFLACPNYPECKNTKSIDEVVAVCPKCGGDILKKRTKAKKIFYGCKNYPKCDFASWDIPYSELCPKCNSSMVVKHYASYSHVKCTKCDYNKKNINKKIEEKFDLTNDEETNN